MNNLINSIGLIATLVTGTDDQKEKLNEADLLIKNIEYNQEDLKPNYIKLDFNSEQKVYVEKDLYIDRQKKETERLKKKRQRLEKIKREKEEARLLVLKQKKEQEELQRKMQEELRKKKEDAARVANTLEQKNKTVASNNEKQPQKSTSNGTTYRITHYTAFCSEGCTGRTASGYSVSNTIYYNGMRIVAADPSIPLYTKLRITYSNGNSFTAIVLDRGGAIRGNLLDVLVSSTSEARSLGRTTAKVEVLN